MLTRPIAQHEIQPRAPDGQVIELPSHKVVVMLGGDGDGQLETIDLSEAMGGNLSATIKQFDSIELLCAKRRPAKL